MTGYTAMIKDSTTLSQWALACARAFGALVHMRDEPADKPVPERIEPSTYHTDRVSRAREKLAALQVMSEEEREQAFNACRAKAVEERAQIIAEHRAELGRLRNMKKRVEEWEPPSAYHDLKRFMLEQIGVSITTAPQLSDEPLYPFTATAWWTSQVTDARQALVLAEECHRREEERCRKANEWLSGLRASLAEYEKGEPARLFHDHLETCPRCSERPFDLCPEGNEILLSTVLVIEAPRFMNVKP